MSRFCMQRIDRQTDRTRAGKRQYSPPFSLLFLSKGSKGLGGGEEISSLEIILFEVFSPGREEGGECIGDREAA